MDLLKNKFLWTPFLILAFLLGADGIARTPSLVDLRTSWRKIEPPIYESRVDLFHRVVETSNTLEPGETIGLLCGSSRSAEFEAGHIEAILPGAKAFNFSAPLAPPSFHYYWIEKILQAGVRPAFIMLEADPLVAATGSNRYALAYSYDLPFILRNTSLFRDRSDDPWEGNGGFSFDETETFLLKNLFSLYKYPLDMRNIKENRKQMLIPGKERHRLLTGVEFKKELEKTILDANELTLGGIPNLFHFVQPIVSIEDDAKDVMSRFNLYNYRADQTQIAFLKRTIRLITESRIPLIVYWPVESEALKRELDQAGVTMDFKNHLKEFLAEVKTTATTPVLFMDPQDDPALTCRAFVDSNHLSGSCYQNLSKVLFSPLKGKL